jgi:hypothetical protein
MRRGLFRRPKRRTGIVAAAVLLLLALIVWLFGARLASPLVRWRLRATIAAQVHAELQMSAFEYHPPFGVTLHDARFILPGEDGSPPLEVLSARKIEVYLASSPLSRGPLVVQSLVIEQPTLHLVSSAKSSAPPHDPPTRLSGILELRRVKMSGGQVVVEDRAQPRAVPLAWKNLDIDLRTAPSSGGEYDYHLAAGDGSVALLQSSGTFLIDDLLLRIADCRLRVGIDPKADTSPLPAQLQQLLRDAGASGVLSVTLAGDVPLRDPAASNFKAQAELKGAGRLPGAAAPLDRLEARVRCIAGASSTPTTRPSSTQPANLLKVIVEAIDVHGGGAAFHLDHAEAVLNRSSNAWGLSGLSGWLDLGDGGDASALPPAARDAIRALGWRGRADLTLHGSGPLERDANEGLKQLYAELRIVPTRLQLQPTAFGDPLTELGELAITLSGGRATLGSPIRAKCGNDLLFIRAAELPLASLATGLRLEHLGGAITFDREPARYPAALNDVIAAIHPRGPFFFEGTFALGPKNTPDYDLHITTARGGLRLNPIDRPMSLTGLNLDMSLTPAAAQIRRLAAEAFTGHVSVSGRVDLSPSLAVNADLSAEEIDLNELVVACTVKGQKPVAASGELRGKLHVTTSGRDGDALLANLTAEGNASVRRADIWRVPLPQAITRALGIRDEDLSVADIYSGLKVASRKVELSELKVESPVVGIHGGGTVGFDSSLRIDVVASHVLQLNTGPVGALYDVRARGTCGNPQVTVHLLDRVLDWGGGVFNRVFDKVRPPPSSPSTPSTRP